MDDRPFTKLIEFLEKVPAYVMQLVRGQKTMKGNLPLFSCVCLQ